MRYGRKEGMSPFPGSVCDCSLFVLSGSVITELYVYISNLTHDAIITSQNPPLKQSFLTRINK